MSWTGTTRAALYLDFDNVFGGLSTLDPAAALRFAENPADWLLRLTVAHTISSPRRWLVLRCYMNPDGSVPATSKAGSNNRIYFRRFRPYFTAAGFEVVDCPRLTQTKNAADIRLVLDARDALDSGNFDEFVIASGDSDMTPLLVRLRAADRILVTISPSDAAEAFTAVSHLHVDGQELLALLEGEIGDESDDREGRGAGQPPSEDVLPDAEASEAALRRFRKVITKRYRAAAEPLNMATLAHEAREAVGAEAVRSTNWLGHGSFGKAVNALDLSGLVMSQHHIWDSKRHVPPSEVNLEGHGLPESAAELARLLGLPRLRSEVWISMYETLVEYAKSHEFNLTEATRWSRDRLAAQGIEVSRTSIGFVTRGVAYGGCPVYQEPTPEPCQLARAFADNVILRAHASGLSVSETDEKALRIWLAGGL